MIQFRFEKNGTLLAITFSGHVTREEAARYEGDITKEIATVQPGFPLLSDLSRLDSMDPECLPFISKVMDLLNEKGVSLVVRVIPDPHKDIGLNILSLFHYRHGMRIVTCSTLEEAREVLSTSR